jgi:hypothetical protein
MLLYGQDDHLDDNATPREFTVVKRKSLLTKLRAELDAVKAENKLLMAETESLKNARQNLVDRIVDLIREKGDR